MSLLRNKNVSYATRNLFCTGCGMCEDVCPKHSIKIARTSKSGELRPIVDDTCIKCGKCLKVCPGIGIEFEKYKNVEKLPNVDKYIGNYVALHTGYSLDQDIRYHSASGGMVSQFLIYLLEKNVIDGAVVTGFGEDKITPVSYIARTRAEIIAARSSKYCPVALNGVINELAALEDGRYVIVGLPCHIQGLRKRMSIDVKLRERILGVFSIYCSSGRTYNAQDFLFKHYAVEKQAITSFAYRDNGCLGNLTIESPTKSVSIPFTHFYGPMLRSFFKSHRCLTCIDHYGELADVNFGDIHIAPYDEDHIGISSWITRSEFWEQQFQRAQDAGYIHMDSVDADTLNRSQKAMLYPKKRKARAIMTMDKMRGRVVPKYDRPLDLPSFKDYVTEIICLCQMFIGRHRGLWWIIEMLNKKE